MAKKALCLSGGGARGSFQIGAIKCLYEVYGFRPDVIAGTSVGAVNGIKLAAAPPLANNDSESILIAVRNGQIDKQLKQAQELEKLWFDFMLSQQGQEIFVKNEYTFSARTGFKSPLFTGPEREELARQRAGVVEAFHGDAVDDRGVADHGDDAPPVGLGLGVERLAGEGVAAGHADGGGDPGAGVPDAEEIEG